MDRENSQPADRRTVVASHTADADLGRQPQVCVSCPICGSSRMRTVCSAPELEAQRRDLLQFYRRRWRRQNAATAEDRAAFTQNYLTDIVTCVNCALLYRNPRPPQEAIVRAYAEDRYDQAYLQAEFLNQRRWARRKLPHLRQRLAQQAERPHTPRVLEVGSFVGGFLAEGLSEGWDMLGVDPGREVTAFCRGQGLPVVQSTLQDAALKPGSFDAILIWNTFDQLPDPHPILMEAVRLLTNGGLLVIRVPNGLCFSATTELCARLPVGLTAPLTLFMAWNNLLTFPYLYGYSAPTLTTLTASYGFRRIACVPDTLMPAPAGHTKLWARLEERLCHLLCQVSWQPGWSSDRLATAPWLDLYFERACTDDNKAPSIDAGLGFVPVYVPTAFGQSQLDAPGMKEAKV
jgi:SAM-dependent methyltransferase